MRERLLAILRIAVGATFVGFGIGKFTHHDAEAAAFDRYGVPLPDAATYLIGSVELTAGVLLVLGLGTRWAALAVMPVMLGAITTAGRIEGGPVHLGLAPALLASAIVLACFGGGSLSLDARRRAASRQPAVP